MLHRKRCFGMINKFEVNGLDIRQQSVFLQRLVFEAVRRIGFAKYIQCL
jgi:hypothetical protein